MEETSKSDDICDKFMRVADESKCFKEAVYWAIMTAEAKEFLDTIDGLLDGVTTSANDWKSFLKHNDVGELHNIFECSVNEYGGDVIDTVAEGITVFLEKAKDEQHLERLLSEEWDPCSDELLALKNKYKSECSKICEEIAVHARSHFNL